MAAAVIIGLPESGQAAARAMRLVLCLVAAGIVLAGCSTQALRWPADDSYVVKSGDSLYSIAWRYNLDFRQLAAWNGLSVNDVIHPGQKLRLTKPAGGSTTVARTKPRTAPPSKPATKTPAPRPVGSWRWPASGELVSRFGQAAPGQAPATGIDLAGTRGDSIVAAASGTVVYSGSGLIGLGKLIIVKHNKTYLSAYGHNSELLVAEGDEVSAGQPIGKMGVGAGNRALLHFEIRLNGEPVDPLKYLPAR